MLATLLAEAPFVTYTQDVASPYVIFTCGIMLAYFLAKALFK